MAHSKIENIKMIAKINIMQVCQGDTVEHLADKVLAVQTGKKNFSKLSTLNCWVFRVKN